MKKLFSFACVALLFSLTGCGEATSTVSDADKAIVIVEGKKITRGEVFATAKAAYGGSFAMNEAITHICDAEKVKIDKTMEEEAAKQLEETKKNSGEDFASLLKQSGFKDEKEYTEKQIYPSLRQKKLVKSYVKIKKKSLFNEYTPRKAKVLETDTKEKADNALAALKNGSTFEEVIAAYNASETYKGEAAVYNKDSGLSAVAYNRILAMEKIGLIATVMEDTTSTKFYVIEVVGINPNKFIDEAVESIATSGQTELSNKATAYYLKKYDFKVYDQDIYDSIKSSNEFIF